MQVLKRAGLYEDVDVTKIVSSLKRYCALPNVDVYRIATKTINGLVDGVSTLELDLLSVRTAKDLIIEDPIYAKVAGRILANIIQKEVAGQDIQSFSQSIEVGLQQGLIATDTHDLVMRNKRKLNAAVKHERDWNMEYHGLQTVYDRYLLKHPTLLNADKTTGKKQRAVIETPQYFFMRVACGLSNDAAEAVELYNLLSSLEYMCSTPTLFNAGTTHSQMSSCFIAGTSVTTVDGMKAIEDVKVGDRVMTHRSREKPVTQLHRNRLAGRVLYNIQCEGGRILTVTGDHRFWSVFQEQTSLKENLAWNQIASLRVGDWIATSVDVPSEFVRLIEKSVSTFQPEYVYTLGVKDDHSYPVEGLICENCYLLDSPLDSLDDIYKRYADIAMLSKFAGGIGASMSRLRGKGSLIKGTNGKSNGLVPWAHTLSGSVAAVNQCLHPDMPIANLTGTVTMKDLHPGDMVQTHTANYRAISKIFAYDAPQEQMIRIVQSSHVPRSDLFITTGHPVLVLRANNISKVDLQRLVAEGKVAPQWTEAGLIEPDDFIVYPFAPEDGETLNIGVEGFTDRTTHLAFTKVIRCEPLATPDRVHDLEVEVDHSYVTEGGTCHNGGKRKGAACIYLETHHPDIMAFLELKDNTGEKEQRAFNLNLANWVSDLFMERVKDDDVWSLFDPSVTPELSDLYGDAYAKCYRQLELEGKFTEQLPARKVYARNGWMCFKDTSNRRGNQVNDEAGTMIHLSNLCVAPETLILTDRGHVQIVDLADTSPTIWNGSEWSKVGVVQTGTEQPLLHIEFSNGMNLDCTPYHKFFIKSGTSYTSPVKEVRAVDLQIGDRIIKHELPVIIGDLEFSHAYTHGFFCGDGTYDRQKEMPRPRVSLYHDKKSLVSVLETIGGTGLPDAQDRLNYRLPLDLPAKFVVPAGMHTIQSRLDWFAGLADADGTVTNVNGALGIQIGSVQKAFIRRVQLMLQTLGVHSTIGKAREAGTVHTQELERLLIVQDGITQLLALGAKFHRLQVNSGHVSQRKARRFVTVQSVEDRGRTDNTFCFNEPKRHCGIFNGILTSQCTEILEVTSSGQREHLPRELVNELSATDMMEKNINIIGFDTNRNEFEVLHGAEVAVCLIEGTPVLTRDGYQAIERCDNVEVYVPYKSDVDFTPHGRFIRAQLIDNGRREVFALTLHSGTVLRATEDHPFLTRRVGFEGMRWKMVSELDNEDFIINGTSTDTPILSRVANVEPAGIGHVYDLRVPEAHHFVAAGLICHNCNLGSINIGRGYVKAGKLDKEKLHKNVALAVKYLDRVIDRNFYPVPEARASNMRWRPIGLGLMGLADFFFQMRIPFDSAQAIALSAEIQEEIYFGALRTSCDLAQELGRHRDFALTRAAKGQLQFDLAGQAPTDLDRWAPLRADIMQHGLRNSLMISLAPTATISHICGVEEAIEPIKSNLLKRETLSGEFISINKYLVDDLRKIGRWNAETVTHLKTEQGDIGTLKGLPAEMYDLYKTVWEMSMKTIIAHGVARGAFIDQSHSLNMFVDLNKHPEDRRIGVLSSLYMHAWEMGLKTTYYLRSKSATRIEQTTNRVTAPYSNGVDTSGPSHVAAENPEVCESCT
jgi:ribonucleotide reductase alpha subunit